MLDISSMIPVFSSVFMAELGDKTQVATVCFTAGRSASKLEVFIASSVALVLSSFIAVVFGAAMGKFISPQFLKVGAGILFIIMGAFFVLQGLRKPSTSKGASE